MVKGFGVKKYWRTSKYIEMEYQKNPYFTGPVMSYCDSWTK
jgi:hypothetical protein